MCKTELWLERLSRWALGVLSVARRYRFGIYGSGVGHFILIVTIVRNVKATSGFVKFESLKRPLDISNNAIQTFTVVGVQRSD